MTNHSTDQKIYTRSNKPSERSCKRKRGRAHGSVVLFGKPKAEQCEISAKKSQEKQAGYERPQSIGQIKNPAKSHKNKDTHSREIDCQRWLAAKTFRQDRGGKATEYGADGK